MKKFLIGILIILLCIMAYFALFEGIALGEFKILKLKEIQQDNENLSAEIAKIETLMQSDFQAKTEELDKTVSKLLEAKNQYLDLASMSTEGELSEANQQETYKIEYLWTRVGNHATAEGVNLKMDVAAGETGEADMKNLNFTVSGNYIAITNFIASLEDDSELEFKIENFKMVPGGENLQATFVTKNIRIKTENVSNNPAASSNTPVPDNNAGTNTPTNPNQNTAQ